MKNSVIMLETVWERRKIGKTWCVLWMTCQMRSQYSIQDFSDLIMFLKVYISFSAAHLIWLLGKIIVWRNIERIISNCFAIENEFSANRKFQEKSLVSLIILFFSESLKVICQEKKASTSGQIFKDI